MKRKKRKRYFIVSKNEPVLYWNPIFAYLVPFLNDNCYMSYKKAIRQLEYAIMYSKNFYPFAKGEYEIKEQP